MKTQIAAVILLVLVFFKVASEVREGDQGSPEWVTDFDSKISALAYHARTPELTRLALRATTFGSTVFLTIATSIVAIFLWLRRNRRSAWFVVVVGIGVTIISPAMKVIFDRQRPSQFPMLAQVTSQSFPSGHTFGSTAIFFAFAMLLSRHYRTKTNKVGVFVLFAIIPVLVGISRVYLGVHFASDVIAGMILGIAWTLIAWQLLTRVRVRLH